MAWWVETALVTKRHPEALPGLVDAAADGDPVARAELWRAWAIVQATLFPERPKGA